jgi:hypothetical protein
MLEYNISRERVNLAITEPKYEPSPDEDTKGTSRIEATTQGDSKNNGKMQNEVKVDKSKAKEITIVMKQKTGEKTLKEEQEAKEESIRNELWNHLQDLVKQKNDPKGEIHTTNNPALEKLINQIDIIPEGINLEQLPEPIKKEYEYFYEYDMEGQDIRKEMLNDYENEQKDSIDAWE